MIPKKLHQVFFQLDKPLAELSLFKESTKQFQAMHPDWEYKLWTEEDCLELMRTKLPQYLEFYKNLRYDIQRIDYIRYAILYCEGGIYVDLDHLPLKPFDDLLSNRLIMHNMSNFYEGNKDFVHNDLMGSPKGFLFWQILLSEMEENYKEKENIEVYKTWKGRFVLQTTGPRYLSRVLKAVLPSYRPLRLCWTKWRNENWKQEPKENYYTENHVAGEWLKSF